MWYQPQSEKPQHISRRRHLAREELKHSEVACVAVGACGLRAGRRLLGCPCCVTAGKKGQTQTHTLTQRDCVTARRLSGRLPFTVDNGVAATPVHTHTHTLAAEKETSERERLPRLFDQADRSPSWDAKSRRVFWVMCLLFLPGRCLEIALAGLFSEPRTCSIDVYQRGAELNVNVETPSSCTANCLWLIEEFGRWRGRGGLQTLGSWSICGEDAAGGTDYITLLSPAATISEVPPMQGTKQAAQVRPLGFTIIKHLRLGWLHWLLFFSS